MIILGLVGNLQNKYFYLTEDVSYVSICPSVALKFWEPLDTGSCPTVVDC